MAKTEGTANGRMLKLETEGVASRSQDAGSKPVIYVSSVDGTESISQPYRFRVEFLSSSNIDSKTLLQFPGRLGIKEKTRTTDPNGDVKFVIPTFWRHGIISSFEALGKDQTWFRYRIVLVPKLWKLSLGTHSRVFLNRTVPDIVEDVLKAHGFGKKDYEIQKPLSRKYPKRDYVVQYQESDLQFVSRLLEHEGIFYYFRHEEDRATLVLADANSVFAPHRVPSTLEYRPDRTAKNGDFLRAVLKFAFRHDPMPAEAILKDYNDQTPDLKLLASAPMEGVGEGVKYEYGNHFADDDEGRILAGIRAQELRARERVFSGRTDCPSLVPGATYELACHPAKEFNREYLVTSVMHMSRQDIGEGGTVLQNGFTYLNEFASIPSDVPFRPERITPKPKVAGTITARIDGAGSGEYAEIDDQGRYKVKLPLDLSDRGNGAASSFVRMAQPYAGNQMGMHFPLHKGTEVILTHLNGDPDRPIIAGAVPNPATKSPVVMDNFTQCVIRTGGGNEIVCEDIRDQQYVWMHSPRHDTFLNLGAAHRIGLQEGATLATQLGVSINAGAGVTIAAGCPDHVRGTQGSQSMLQKILVGAGVLLPVLGVAGELGGGAAGALAQIAGAVVDDAIGLVSGTQFPAAFVTAPGNTVVASATGAVMAGGISSTVLGSLSVSVMSPGFANMTGLGGASVIAAHRAEMVSTLSDVEHRAKQNVRILARMQDIHLHAAKRDVLVEAQRDLLITCHEGKTAISTQKEIVVESREVKNIDLVAGKSRLRMTDEEIVLVADRIHIRANDGKTDLVLANDAGGMCFQVDSTGRSWIKSDEGLHLHSEGEMDLFGNKSIKMSSALLDQKRVKEIARGESKESASGASVGPSRKSPPKPKSGKGTQPDRPAQAPPPPPPASGQAPIPKQPVVQSPITESVPAQSAIRDALLGPIGGGRS